MISLKSVQCHPSEAGPGRLPGSTGGRSFGGPRADLREVLGHNWADLREDKMINPAPGFWRIFGPLGPTAGPGSPGNGPGSKNSAGPPPVGARSRFFRVFLSFQGVCLGLPAGFSTLPALL